MNPVIRNILAIIAGIVVGSIINMGIITLGPTIIPPPEGADFSTPEGLKAAMPLLQPKHFLMPFIAHAIGTLCGAYLAAKLSVGNRMMIAMVVGLFFLAGGIAAVAMVNSPTWYTVVDLSLAYLPMAWLGARLAHPRKH